MPSPGGVPELFSIQELAQYLCVTTWTIHNLLRKRGTDAGLPHLKLGRRLYFRKSAVDAWLAAREVR